MSQNSPPRVLPKGAGAHLNILGSLVTFKALQRDTNGAYCQFESHVQPGRGVPPHYHREEDETFSVLAGHFTFVLGEEQVEATTGDYIFIPRETVHGFRNTGAEPGRLLVTATPGHMHEALFMHFGKKVDDPSTPLDPPDEATVAAFRAGGAEYDTLLPTDG